MFEEQYRRDNDKLRAKETLFMEIEKRVQNEKKAEKKRSGFVRYGAVAAAILLIFGGAAGALLALNAQNQDRAESNPAMLSLAGETASSTGASSTDSVAVDATAESEMAVEDGGNTPESYEALFARIVSMSDYYGDHRVGINGSVDTAMGAEPEADAASAATQTAAADMGSTSSGIMKAETAASEGGMGGGDFSETNVQVAGVDEADVVKTDGEYIYYLVNAQLVIVKADGKDSRIVSVTSFADEKNFFGWNAEMFVLGDRLMVISQGFTTVWARSGNNSFEQQLDRTLSYVFDISDRKNPRQVASLGQSGNYVSSRLVGENVYIVTSQYVFNADPAQRSTFVPETMAGGKSTSVAVDSIYVYNDARSPAYTVVGSFNLKDGVDYTDSTATLGGTSDVYCSGEHLLIASSRYTEDVSPIAPDKDGRNVQITNSQSDTLLVLFTLSDGDISRKATGFVEGTLLNQFAMDEYNGAFRIVATVNKWSQRIYTDGVDTYEYDDEQYNALYTLDASLNPLGVITNLAKDEEVKSVRFDGDVAYFVTFRQTDPLFTVDLTDPKNPRVLDYLKIPGFSEYLHVYGENRLLGIGYDADEKTGWRENVKLSMFDTSDKRNVSELVTKALTASFSMAGNNHKAILISTEKNLIAFPADECYYIFSYSDSDGFKELARISVGSDAWSFNMRGLFIGDCFYVCTESAVTVLSLSSFDQLIKLSIAYG